MYFSTLAPLAGGLTAVRQGSGHGKEQAIHLWAGHAARHSMPVRSTVGSALLPALQPGTHAE